MMILMFDVRTVFASAILRYHYSEIYKFKLAVFFIIERHG